MSKKYDIIIIGGGHNGLTAATTLAKKNKKVLLIEKRALLGGIAAGEEFHPGYRTSGLLHDTSAVRSKVIKALNLEKYGLKVKQTRATVSILSKDGKCLNLSADIEKAAQEIAKFSKNDAKAYKEYRAFISKISPFINDLTDNLPPDLMHFGSKQLWDLFKKGIGLKRLGNATMLELLKVAPMSVADFLNEYFETDFIKAGIAAPALYGSFTSPLASYTTLSLLMWECAAQTHLVGGPQALVSALEHAAKAAGVEIKTKASVDKILLNGDRKVTGVKLESGEEIKASKVASSCTPRETFYEFLQPNQIDYSLEHAIKHYRSRGTTAKINLALDKALILNGESNIAFARTGNSFLEMEKTFDPIKYRQFGEEFILDIHVPSIENTALAPAGHSVVSILVHFVPYQLDEGWSETTKNKLYENVIKTLTQYAPDVASSIVGSEVLSPVDLEERYSLTNGHIYHGEQAIDQLMTRPIPSCARYQTPIEGLYLCGSGSHPGGGITGMPGLLASQMIF